jgi:hypothetical protein
MASGHVLAAEDVILRTSVTPEKAWVGQKVVLHVDVLAKDGWAQLRKVRDTEVNGAYLLRLETQGTRLSETIEGETYSGQRYELLLFAQRKGKITVPPVPVEVEVKTWGAGAGSRSHPMSTPLVEFVARTPPGAEDIRGLISTTRLMANQKWEPETAGPKVGDAVKRTIMLKAPDVSGMAFAPMEHPEITGLGIYSSEPTVEDAYARGTLTGTRIETVTYVFERPGEIGIPGVVLFWWDIGDQKLRRVELPGRSLKVVGVPATVTAATTEARHQQNMPRWWLVLGAAIAAIIALAFRSSLWSRWEAWKKAKSETEAMYFRRIIRSARSGDARATLRDTMRWIDRINVGPESARLDLFLRSYGDARTQESASLLVRSLTMDGDIHDMSVLSRGLARARARWRQAQRRIRRATKLLPELNGLHLK